MAVFVAQGSSRAKERIRAQLHPTPRAPASDPVRHCRKSSLSLWCRSCSSSSAFLWASPWTPRTFSSHPRVSHPRAVSAACPCSRGLSWHPPPGGGLLRMPSSAPCILPDLEDCTQLTLLWLTLLWPSSSELWRRGSACWRVCPSHELSAPWGTGCVKSSLVPRRWHGVCQSLTSCWTMEWHQGIILQLYCLCHLCLSSSC